ncbi:toxin ParE1/3/4 [Rhodopseudomonas julia]|uniref:Toxin ParE1/3/4 n=1 Tax=Rhodopseudomonas julia TaxID=200617 RepID=A0ABU0C1X9_9BRAD|nr:type II toxin-antitoxin system RelE/ParE family toxin [Rhodopseudomonas julia]MDQ0324514.1 toxin ParE1/3/4 [Rhodopseudomonas julia]
MNYELTLLAENDVQAILQETLTLFGPKQTEAYAGIIRKGIERIAEDPVGPGTLDRSDVAKDVRFFHLALAAGRRHGAAHCLYFKVGALSDGSTGTIILRVLHERMAPRHHLAIGNLPSND